VERLKQYRKKVTAEELVALMMAHNAQALSTCIERLAARGPLGASVCCSGSLP